MRCPVLCPGLGLFLLTLAGAPAPLQARERSEWLLAIRTLSPDSTEARLGLIREGPPVFAGILDSLMASPRTEPAAFDGLKSWGGDYLAATGDSLLLRDASWLAGASPGAKAEWFRGVQADRSASALQTAKDYPGAAARFDEAVHLYRSAGDLRREAVALGSRGVALWLAGDFDAAREAYLAALDARRRLGDPILIGRTLNALGSVAQQTGDYPLALDYYGQARAVRESAGDVTGLGTTLAYIGNVHFLLGRLEEARAGYERSLQVFGPDAAPASLYPARLGLANVNVALGEFQAAVDIYRTVLEVELRQNDARKVALTRRNIAIPLWRLGDYAGALNELEVARRLQEGEGDNYQLAGTINQIGRINLDLGDKSRALAAFQEAEKVAREAADPRSQASALINTGLVYSLMNLHTRAFEAFERAKPMLEELGDDLAIQDLLNSMTGSKVAAGDLEGALELGRQSLAASQAQNDGPRTATAHGVIGNIHIHMGRPADAIPEFRAAFDLASSRNLDDVLWKSCLGLADCFQRLGSLDSARVYNGRAIEIIEQRRNPDLPEASRASFLEERLVAYDSQVQVLAEMDRLSPGSGHAGAALSVAEQGKARALLDLLAEGHVDLDRGIDPALASERRQLERAIKSVQYRLRLAESGGAAAESLAAARKEESLLQEKHGAVLARMRVQNPRFGTLDAARPATIEAIRKDLLGPKKSALLEYALGDSVSFAWLLTRDDITLRRLPGRKEIDAAVLAARSALKEAVSAGDRMYLDNAARLYDMLVRPLEAELKGVRHLFVVPDGTLGFLPFETLVRTLPGPEAEPGDRNRMFRELDLAFRECTVQYGPSATTLAMLARAQEGPARRPPLDLLAVGDPVFEAAPDSGHAVDSGELRGGLRPLPHTRAEVQSIGALFPADRRTLLLGDEARESTLASDGFLGQYGVIHLATHGVVDERRPERSSVALSLPRDPSEDGYLQASEIYGLELNADLVVLSACETGLGRMVRGEGILGLPRAFLFAGASSVVVSLWSVSDRSTAEFMIAFYREMVSHRRSPAEALARVKESFRASEEFSHPFYWAPFVLIGAR